MTFPCSQKGGFKSNSYIIDIIRKINRITNQDRHIKRTINNLITNTGHGSIFLGTASNMPEGDMGIRILVGTQYKRNGLNINVFGGKANRGEKTIHTMIRETIEEIFNFIPCRDLINRLELFINSLPNSSYHIHDITDGRRGAFSYIFDVGILGDFIQIINDMNKGYKLIVPYPHGREFILSKYILYVNFSDRSSVHGVANDEVAEYNTIDLNQFMIDRYVDRPVPVHSLNEVKYLSFPSLFKLQDEFRRTRSYNIYNSITNSRERLDLDRLLINILRGPLLDIIRQAL
jgi:hypothetical protein